MARTARSKKVISRSVNPKKRAKSDDDTAAGERTIFNIGGTRYEVSKTVVEKFPEDSMLAKICSEIWNQDSDDKEIYIDRNGQRFQYVLDYMRDGSVQLPLSIPRGQLIKDFDYYGLAYTEKSITLSVADPKDLFQGLAQYKEYFTALEAEIEVDYMAVLARKVACCIAKQYFSVVCMGDKTSLATSHLGYGVAASTGRPSYFEPQTFTLDLRHQPVSIPFAQIEPHLNNVGLTVSECNLNARYYNSLALYPDQETSIAVELLQLSAE